MANQKVHNEKEEIYDPKANYIIRTLSRTRRKDYENYIINAIWNRLIARDIEDLKPVSQAYMRSAIKPNKYYLVDLYFPQLHIGIECDEGYHANNMDVDKARELDIQEMYRRISEENYTAIHITVYKKTFDEIEDEIKKAVEDISESYRTAKELGKIEKWVFEENTKEVAEKYFKNKTEITVDDEIIFPTIASACNIILGSNYHNMQRGFFYPQTAFGKTDEYVVWTPRLATKQYASESAKTMGKFRNVLSDDGLVIHESCDFKSLRILKKDIKGRKPRVTFGYVIDPVTRSRGWKFLGVYEFDYPESGVNIYRRTSDKFEIKRKH